MRKSMILPGLAALIMLVAASCTKDPLKDMTAEDSRIYITNYDSTANFGSYKTFSIADSVAVIDNGRATKEITPTDQAYLDAVKKYMQQQGYVLVNKSQSPDLGMNVSRIYRTSTGVISYPDYWGYYGGYWDPYYWGYPGYGYYVPYSYAVYSVTEGAISVDMLDLKSAKTTNKISIIWTGPIRGSGILNASVADSQVKALFDQSPYIKAN